MEGVGVPQEGHVDAVDVLEHRVLLLLCGGRAADVVHAGLLDVVQRGLLLVEAGVQGVVVGHGEHVHAAVGQRVEQAGRGDHLVVARDLGGAAQRALHVGHGVVRVAHDVGHVGEHVGEVEGLPAVDGGRL